MAYPHHRVEFVRAAVEEPSPGFLDLTLMPQVYNENWETYFMLEVFTDILTIVLALLDHYNFQNLIFSLPGKKRRTVVYIIFSLDPIGCVRNPPKTGCYTKLGCFANSRS